MTGEAQDNNWPLPKFCFCVQISGQKVAFQEVMGLEAETEILEYRAGNSKNFSTLKMPGMVKSGTVSLKKGVFVNDDGFWNWYNKIKLNTIARDTVIIELLDQDGAPTMAWTLNNAWPTKIIAPDLHAEGNEIAVETIELAHEGLSIQNG